MPHFADSFNSIEILECDAAAPQQRRRGSTLLIVVALLGMLAFLGFVFYTFSAQERSAAEYYAEAARTQDTGDLGVDTLWDWSLEQLIVGPDVRLKNSALWGSRHALVSNMYGRDLNAFTGRGVNVVADANGVPIVDQDYDDQPDPLVDFDLDRTADGSYLQFNDSPVANGLHERRLEFFPEPDVDYTYPDINHVFLAYDGRIIDGGNTQQHVVIPSFHRPQYLRQSTGSAAVPIGDWAVNPATISRVMRPHPLHLHAPSDELRFLDANNPADAAAIAALPGGSGGFPFLVDSDADSVPNEQGVWSRTSPADASGYAYEYDVDNNGDGLREGVWLDLDFPVQERASDGALYVPLFSFTVTDADALLNLNVHGNVSNLSGETVLNPTGRFGGSSGYGPDDQPGVTGVDDDGVNGVDDVGELGVAGSDDTGRISASNQGISPSEVNLLWALDADPNFDQPLASNLSTVCQQHNLQFGNLPATRDELANMEWWFAVKGRAEYSGSLPGPVTIGNLHAGRNGEVNLLWSALAASAPVIPLGLPPNPRTFPFPGVSGVDDNGNSNEGGSVNQNLGQTLPFVHPLSFDGHGRITPLGKPKELNMIAPISGNPIIWLQYENFGLGGPVALSSTLSGALLPSPPASTGSLDDDEMELTVEPNKLRRPLDEPFGVDEMAFLHMVPSDVARTGVSSRIKHLMPANTDPTANSRAVDIRQRFTTLSWDLKQFSFPKTVRRVSSLEKPGEQNVDDDGNGTIDDISEFGWPNTDDVRAWEFNADTDRRRNQFTGKLEPAPDGRPEFPPEFEGSPAYSETDPFQPQLRRLLEFEVGEQTEFKLMSKLSINHVLDVVRRPGQPGDERDGPLEFRPLTPHATDASITSLPPADPLPPFPPTNPAEQEFWARRDRQKLARDIYVLMVTFCGGHDGLDPTQTNFVSGFSFWDEIAQFAVNAVDALDRDNVITCFEYDRFLARGSGPDGTWNTGDDTFGWNLNDDPFDDDGFSVITSPGDRHAAYGHEGAQMTFSESLGIRSRKIDPGSNHAATLFDDTSQERHYLFLELRNASPFDLPLASPTSTSASTGLWRIRHRDHNASTLTLLNSVGGAIPPGGQFLIGTSDGSDVELMSNLHRASDFRVDFDLDTEFDLIAPHRSDFSPVPTMTTLPSDPNGQPKCDLDLVHSGHAGRFEMTPAGTGYFVKFGQASGPVGKIVYELVLERRLNLQLPNLSEVQNPWAWVDHHAVVEKSLDLSNSTTAAQIHNPTGSDLLDRLKSRERPLPFLSASTGIDAVSYDEVDFDDTLPAFNDGIRYNTLGHLVSGPPVVGTDRNSRTPEVTPNWHFEPHFDRDYASAVELFNVLALGAATSIDRNLKPPLRPFPGWPFAFIAGQKFLQPVYFENIGLPATTDSEAVQDNRWYRILEFLEVPTRTHRQLGNPLDIKRIPGKTNLNTVRHPEVLAALLDDPDVFHRPERDWNGNAVLDPFEDLNGNGRFDYGLADRTGEPARDWWWHFLAARDQLDGVSGLILPGVANAKPFRSFNYLSYSPKFREEKTIDRTLLRGLPLVNVPGVAQLITQPHRRRLFELGTESEHRQGELHYYNRHRLLSKIIGNTTTRSNVFIVFASVGFFEATETPGGAVRIGGELDVDNNGQLDDGHRGFFIIDRSLAQDAYDPSTRSFDWQELVKHRLTIH